MTDLYASHQQFNSSLNSSFNHSFYAAPSRSYSVQDIATLPGLAPGVPAYGNVPHYAPHNYHVNHPASMSMSMHAGIHPQNGSAYPPLPAASPHVDPAYAQWLVRYRQWYDYVQNMQRERMRQLQPLSERARLTPHRFPHRHTRVSFGVSREGNRLVTAKGTIVSIQPIDASLIDLEEEIQVTTWPGPLIKGETKKDDVLEYIRTRESVLKHDQSPESYFKSHERKQIWSLLSMIVRQNGTLSGADLSELLLSNNENEFESPDEADDIGKLRRYLTLGQRKTALEFAQKTGLWGHVTSLVLFSNPVSSNPLVVQFSNVVTKFMNSTLSREDPLFILYRSLLTKIQTSGVSSASSNTKQQVTTDTLQQFAILLANDCDVNPCVKDYSRASELLKLIVGIKKEATQHIVNLANLDLEHDGSEKSFKDLEQNYSEELVFINEIWEYARPQTQFIERLVPLKTLLASRLFDFGLVTQASHYCYAIRQYFKYYSHFFPGKAIADSSIDWDVVIDFVTDLECRMYGFDVTKGANDQSDITEKKVEPEEERSIVTEGTSQADADTEDDGSESEWDRQPDPPLTAKVLTSKPPVQPQQKQQQQSVLQRRESQMSSVSGATSADAGSRAPSSQSIAPGPYMRSRTLSKENASPPTTPARNGPSPQAIAPAVPLQSVPKATFQPLPATEANASSAQIFVPAANNTAVETIPEFNFVSSYAPTADSPLSPNFPDDLRDDGDAGRRESLTPFVHNSTAVPGFSSPGQFPNAFSPIAAPSGDISDQLNGLSLSQSSPQQNHHSAQNQSQQRPQPQNGSNTSPDSPVDGQDRSANKTSGWFNSLIRKVVPPGAKQAVLPDDKDPPIVYDERLKRWVDKNGTSDNQLLNAIQNGPPRMSAPTGMVSATSMPQLSSIPTSGPAGPPMPNGGNNFSYMSGSMRRKPQYVDVWQQQQQQKQQSRN